MPKVNILLLDTKNYVKNMLKSEPEDAGPELLDMWKNLSRMTIERFEYFLRKVEPDWDQLDIETAKIDQWEKVIGEDEGSYNGYGMRHRLTGNAHGIARAVKPGEWFTEGTGTDGNANVLLGGYHIKSTGKKFYEFLLLKDA